MLAARLTELTTSWQLQQLAVALALGLPHMIWSMRSTGGQILHIAPLNILGQSVHTSMVLLTNGEHHKEA